LPAYYNEIDPYAAQWLRNLITAGLIAPGDVDERSIVDVRGDDLAGYEQCHFFAGIGGWSYALRLAGWPDDRPVWTGSCPCQSLSSAGQRKGHADKRHLWPAFHTLIAERQPATVFGEQVASKDGREWLAAVRADLEATRHAVGAADLCAAGAGAPHIRQRLFWVADASGERRQQERRCSSGDEESNGRQQNGDNVSASDGESHGRLANAGSSKWRMATEERNDADGADARWQKETGGYRLHCTSGLGVADGTRRDARIAAAAPVGHRHTALSASGGFWSDIEWLYCADGKSRPTKPGLLPLAHGISAGVAKLRGIGNAIVPEVAAEFIGAYLSI
jgi:DNA (cytosine-5)-methyltransferase 1